MPATSIDALQGQLESIFIFEFDVGYFLADLHLGGARPV
jgi:hypothetical protein